MSFKEQFYEYLETQFGDPKSRYKIDFDNFIQLDKRESFRKKMQLIFESNLK